MSGLDQARCYHCGLPVPPGSHYSVVVDGQPRSMCCRGCQAVAQAIVDGGLSEYYRYRTEAPRNPQELIPAALRELDLYDRPDLQKSFVRTEDANVREAALILEGIVCAACVWLNERHVAALPGVLEFRVNYTTHRAQVRWDDRQLHLSDILKAIAAIGYVAHPFDPGRQEAVFKRERTQALRRLAVAGFGTMQVMMFAVALYAGDWHGMEENLTHFMRWVSLLVATPVVFYAGWPFFASAWRDLRRRQLGMDVPVALAVGSTYAASVWATLGRTGDVYFESVSMFVFFLLTGRFLEMNARQRAGEAAEALGKLLPAVATRLRPEGREEVVAVAELMAGDRVRIRPGDTVPADGRVLEGHSSVDEALLTGESLPRGRAPGDALIGGTLNVESPLIMEVEKVGPDTVLSGIQRLLDRAQTEKPRVARLAERGTGWFVALVLALAFAAGAAWWMVDPLKAFWVAVAVMVVSCPCALALATPVAITAATGFLTRLGVLTTRGHALEALAAATHVVFDKTGTLTEGRLHLREVVAVGAMPQGQCLAVAAALEAGSEHPVAHALHTEGATLAVSEQRASPGRGMEGSVDGERYRIGRPDFVGELTVDGRAIQQAAQAVAARHPDASVVALGNRHGLQALLVLADRIRPEAARTVAAFQGLGLDVHLLSGDAPATVQRVADALGIAHYRGALLPADKVEAIRALQAAGAVVAMVGDGVNDAPVLSQAQVSVAMAGGTQLAHASADMILHSEHLYNLVQAVERARATLRIVRQNIGWALGYNLIALPIAASGVLAPWMAAIGMSMSSLLVVLNSLRLTRAPTAGPALESARERPPRQARGARPAQSAGS